MADTMADIGMTRADYGTGSMYQRTSDWRWIAAFESGYTASGTRRRVTVTGKGCAGGCPKRCKHIAAMNRKIRDKKAEREREGHRNVKRTTSVAKWAEAWLANIQPHVRPSAYETDRAAVRVIVAAIGSVKLADLTPDDVRAVARHVRAHKGASSTALRYHGSLMRMLKAASLDGYAIPPNVLLAEKPKKSVHDRQAIPFENTLRVLEHIADMRDGSRWALAFLQGLRQAEALGLTWDALDLDAGTLTISWQVKSLRYVDRANPAAGFVMPDGYEARHIVGATHLVRPKSSAGWRVIPLVPWAVNALRAWRDVEPPGETGLVWPGRTVRGATWPRNPAADRDQWAAIQKAVGIRHPSGRPYHVHEIRNTTATLLMQLRVPESVRIAIMGHSSIAVTQGYEYVDLAESRRALEQAAERLALTTSSD